MGAFTDIKHTQNQMENSKEAQQRPGFSLSSSHKQRWGCSHKILTPFQNNSLNQLYSQVYLTSPPTPIPKKKSISDGPWKAV